jgi:hypothetical protein
MLPVLHTVRVQGEVGLRIAETRAPPITRFLARTCPGGGASRQEAPSKWSESTLSRTGGALTVVSIAMAGSAATPDSCDKKGQKRSVWRLTLLLPRCNGNRDVADRGKQYLVGKAQNLIGSGIETVMQPNWSARQILYQRK